MKMDSPQWLDLKRKKDPADIEIRSMTGTESDLKKDIDFLLKN
jgi:hypothetical protein